MAQKTPAMRPTGEPVAEILDRAQGPRRAEADELCTLLGELTGEQPLVWASRIIGFGEVAFRYESGHSGVMPILAFSPSARQFTLYLTSNFESRWSELMARLGTYRSGTACLYLTRLESIDRDVLRELLEHTRDHALSEWTNRS
jgi:hypothetical protein